MLQIIAVALALVAIACLCVAVVGMITGRPNDRVGWVLRFVALLSFAGAVVLTTIRRS